jgi:hypothetical protein
MNEMTRRINKRNRRSIVKQYNHNVFVPILYTAVVLYIVFYSVFNS